MTPLTTMIGRVAALGLLGLVASGVLFLGILPMLDAAVSLHRAVLAQREMVAQLAARVAGQEGGDGRLRDVEARVAESRLYLRGETGPLAAAAMQEHVKAAVSAHGGQLRSIQTVEGGTVDGLTRVRLRVVMAGHHDELMVLVHALETGEPYLFIHALELTSNAATRRGRRTDGEELLFATLEIDGYRPPETPR